MEKKSCSPRRSVISRSGASSLFFVTLLFLFLPQASRAQAPPCPDAPGGISNTHRFHSLGETLTIPFSMAACHTVAVDISWFNSLNHGSRLKVTFLDSSGQVIFEESTISAFVPGSSIFPLSSPMPYPWRGSRSELFNPASLKIETIGPFGGYCDIAYSLIFTAREGYNVGGDSFANAPMTALPVTYQGSVYDGTSPTQGGSIDPGQFFKVRLKCKQAMYVHGSVTVHPTVSRNFQIDLYDANQNLIEEDWIFTGSRGTISFASTPFVNPNATDTDFYIRAWGFRGPIFDFTLNIDKYVASNSSTNPRPSAPDATGIDPNVSVSSEEYHFTPVVEDRNEVLTGRETELWAKLYWPTALSGPYPLVMFLHGNHNTCGRALTSPRIDDDNRYTLLGACGPAPFFTGGTVGASRNDLAGWFGMRITTGSAPLVVRSLGRMFLSGNSGTHTLRIVRVSDNIQMGSVSLSMVGGANQVMKYQTLASPVTLAANTSYYIVSQEFIGGDLWYDSTATIIGTGAATVDGSASSPDSVVWTVGSTTGRSYGLVDFEYDFTNTTGRSVVQNHLGYEYLATQLASRGYIVASINANRGITGVSDERQFYPNGPLLYPDDPKHIFSRGRLVLKHLETLSKWNTGGSPFITPTTLGTLRRNSNNWFGMKITVGAQPIAIYSLGRMFANGNTGTHTVKIVRASDNTNVPNGSVNIAMSGGTTGQFKYANLTTPVTLAANTSYYIASKEQKNGDYWHDSNTVVSSTSVATVNGRVTSTNGSSWDASGGVLNNVYVPVDFKYQVLSVNLTGKVDFTNVGLMGHSRGGQGVRAAYNLYRTPSIDPRADPDIVWSNKIPNMNIKGIFEIAPTDTFLPALSNGNGSQYLNADGTAWNVLLPMCDGDVFNLEGVRVFDRQMAYTGNNPGIPADSPPKQKSTYTVWGANHNFYNTEWQGKDFFTTPLGSGCVGIGNGALFANPPTDGSGSPNQRTTGLASVLAFFRANVGAAASATFNQNFNPRYDHPGVITSMATPPRIDRGFTPSPSASITKVLFDFIPSNPPSGTTYDVQNVNFGYDAIPEHDYFTNPISCDTAPCPNPVPVEQMLSVGNVTWDSAGCDHFFQANWRALNTGDNISTYQSLDFRVSRRDSSLNSSAATDFQIQLIQANGNPTGASVSVSKYFNVTGPVGVSLQINGMPVALLHPILQTVRIPLGDFVGANLTQVRGVRFILSSTPSGAVSLANIRLVNAN